MIKIENSPGWSGLVERFGSRLLQAVEPGAPAPSLPAEARKAIQAADPVAVALCAAQLWQWEAGYKELDAARRTISERDLDTLAQIHHAHANALQALLIIDPDDARAKLWHEQFQAFRDLYARLHRNQPHEFTQAARDVLAERARQVHVYELTAERDDQYRDGELATAAGCYALHTRPLSHGMCPVEWPWDSGYWKPTTPRRALEKAGALILAEIERIDRAAEAERIPTDAELAEAIHNAPADVHAIEHKGQVVFLNRGTSDSDWLAMANIPHGELQAEVVSIQHLAGEIRLQLPAGAEVPQDLESGMMVDVLYTPAAAGDAA